MLDLKKKFSLICNPIPTYKLCDDIGIDAETAYILDLSTEENYELSNEYLKKICPTYEPIDKRYIGKHVIIEADTNGEDAGYWYIIHGDIDEYTKRVRKALKEYIGEKEETEYCEWIKYDYRTICPKNHDINNPYWKIPDNMDKLKYCPYCSKKIVVED